jgi:NFU1 iron-sulfur cluster scaffold homolog, mitochondrial
MNMKKQKCTIRIQATPNPNSWKFVLDCPVIDDGQITYMAYGESDNDLIRAVFAYPDTVQVHMVSNTVTVTFDAKAAIEPAKEAVKQILMREVERHDSSFLAKKEKAPAELVIIDEIIERKIRPILRGDGGDVTVVELQDNVVYIKYRGACGSCPASTAGTLILIRDALRSEFNSDVEVKLWQSK